MKNNSSWQPVDRQILVKIISPQDIPGRIIIPESARITQRGLIEKIGPAVPRSLTIGDEVVFVPEKSFPVDIDGEYAAYFVMPYNFILLHKRNTPLIKEII